ncbi:MAG TPA: molybdenum cofactor guanylyltransferase [Sphingomonas sp.]|nr:molybdenum cofactor guanylyltransferase [Sphingomonas sp.]
MCAPRTPFARGRARILGAVLAGGRSRRFGSDKAFALLDGRPLIAHAASALGALTGQVVICGHDFPPFETLADLPEPDMGPLGGLNAALAHARLKGFDGVLSTGCDMPVLPADVAAALIGDEAAVVEGQHLIGWWPAALAPMLDAHLRTTRDRSMRGWFALVGPRLVRGPALPNINTPADLRAWEDDR